MLTLILIRHAHAGNSLKWILSGKADKDRPLSKKGQKKFELASCTLVKEIKPTLVVHSEKLRSSMTADILCKKIPKVERLMTNFLGDQFNAIKLEDWIFLHSKLHSTICLIGHEPHLSEMMSHLLTNDSISAPDFYFKKGGAAQLHFDQKKKIWELDWQLSQKDLI